MFLSPEILVFAALAFLLSCGVFLLLNNEFHGNFLPAMKRNFFSRSTEISFEGKRLVLDEGVHIPTRDTVFMYRNLKGELHGSVLEIGTGCGAFPVLVNSEEIEWVCTEIDKRALDNARRNFEMHGVRAETIVSDVFADVTGKYDFIVWNFPFIYGSGQIMKRFIHGLGKHLKKNGKAYLLSSLIMKSRYPDFEKDCKELGIRPKIIARGRYHVVPIYLYELEQT